MDNPRCPKKVVHARPEAGKVVPVRFGCPPTLQLDNVGDGPRHVCRIGPHQTSACPAPRLGSCLIHVCSRPLGSEKWPAQLRRAVHGSTR
eukprot:1559021-Rhodomonas_salina.1